jgi:MFS transporter, ACS family, glucarate transporter
MSEPTSPPAGQVPTRVRYGVLGFACSLSMITYLDRVCFGTVAPFIQSEFGLSDTQKGLLFSAFALAYAVFEVPTGWLGDVFGPRRTLIRIVVWWSAFTALTGMIYPSERWPWFGFTAMLAVRFLFGVGEAGAYPNIARAFHNWFPFGERGSAQGAVWMAGRFAGGVTPLVVLALIVEEGSGVHRTVHWRHTFWIFGSLGVLWCAFFWWWFRDRPEQKPEVNEAELELIRHGEGPAEPAHRNVPWGRLLSNGNLWVLCAMYFCAAYGWYFNITYLPGYLKDYYGITPGEKWSWQFWQFSLMAGAPLLLGSLACLVGGILTDRFIRRTGNRKWGRRLFGVIGHGLCALCYFASIFAANPWVFVLAIALAAFWNDITMGSAWASCLDIGRKYSGIVAGCMNTIGNLGGAVAGFATGLILDLHTAAARLEGARSATSLLGMPAVAGGGPLVSVGQAGALQADLADAARPGWTVNFLIFGGVYVIATLLWLRFDATKPVIPEAEEGRKTAAGAHAP